MNETRSQIGPNNVDHFRAAVRERLSARNRIAAIIAVAAACLPIGFALAGEPATGWPLAVALLSGPAWMLVWSIRSVIRPRFTCPNCGDNWEYESFLMSNCCESCGLELPTERAKGDQ